MLAISTLLLSLAVHSCVAQTSPVAEIGNGSLEGLTCPNGKVYGYLAIPYAEPPIGDLRLKAPKPFRQEYSGQYTKPPPSCIQFGNEFIETGPQSEDCLFLDIWTPSNGTNTTGLPVKVFIHGGAMVAGGISNPTYNGCNSAVDAIHVNIAYRLGPLGGFALQSAGFYGNYHIQDLLLALQWIQDHIAAFGGNKDKVMLFGQSAGADNTFVLATLPQAPSLFHSAILESGGGGDYQTIEGVKPFMLDFATALNCSYNDTACIRSKTPQEMNASLALVPGDPSVMGDSTLLGPVQNWWYAVIDCDIVPAQPADVGVGVSTIIGSTSKEATLFTLPIAPGHNPAKFTQADYDRFLDENFGPFASEVNATYPAAAFNQTGYGVYAAMEMVGTDSSYTCTAYRALQAAATKNVPVWTYRWAQEPSCDWFSFFPNSPAFLAALGATHTSEIPFVFGNTANIVPSAGNCSFSSGEKALSNTMLSAWNSMAADATPGTWWPQFADNNTLGINVANATAVAGLVDYSVCDFWARINTQIRQNVTRVAYEPSCASNYTVWSNTTSGLPRTTSTSHSGASRGLKVWSLSAYPLLAGLMSGLLSV